MRSREANDELPVIEYAPPYSHAFIAHLHGGCYSEDVTTALLDRVRSDGEGRRMLEAVALVQLELHFLR